MESWAEPGNESRVVHLTGLPKKEEGAGGGEIILALRPSFLPLAVQKELFSQSQRTAPMYLSCVPSIEIPTQTDDISSF